MNARVDAASKRSRLLQSQSIESGHDDEPNVPRCNTFHLISGATWALYPPGDRSSTFFLESLEGGCFKTFETRERLGYGHRSMVLEAQFLRPMGLGGKKWNRTKPNQIHALFGAFPNHV